MAPKAPALGINVGKGMPAGLVPLRPDELAAGTLTGSKIRGGAPFTDTTGYFFPIVIDPAGDVTVNASSNASLSLSHRTGFFFHDTSGGADVLMTRNIGLLAGIDIIPNSQSSSVPTFFGLFDMADSPLLSPVSGWSMSAWRGTNGPYLERWDSGASAVVLDGAGGGAGTFYGTTTNLNGEKFAHGNINIGTVLSGASSTGGVSYGVTFVGTPEVVAVLMNTTGPALDLTLYITGATASQLTYVVHNNDGVNNASNVQFRWIAVGTA